MNTKASDFYRVATPEEIDSMPAHHKVWYETGMVPMFLMPDGTIKGQGLDGAYGGCRKAVCRLVTQEWLDQHQDWLNKLDQWYDSFTK